MPLRAVAHRTASPTTRSTQEARGLRSHPKTRRSLRPRKRLRAHREAIAWTGLDTTAVRHRVPRQLSRKGRGMRATDAPVRSGATSGAKRRGASGEGRCRVRRPLRHPLAQDRRAWAEGCRQVAGKRRDGGKRVSVLHHPLLAVPKSEALVFAICKTRFDHAEGDVRPSARLQLASNASDAASTKRDARTTLQERQLTVEQTPRAAMCHLASSSQNRQGGRRGAGASTQRHRLDINKSRLWNRIPKHAT